MRSNQICGICLWLWLFTIYWTVFVRHNHFASMSPCLSHAFWTVKFQFVYDGKTLSTSVRYIRSFLVYVPVCVFFRHNSTINDSYLKCWTANKRRSKLNYNTIKIISNFPDEKHSCGRTSNERAYGFLIVNFFSTILFIFMLPIRSSVCVCSHFSCH